MKQEGLAKGRLMVVANTQTIQGRGMRKPLTCNLVVCPRTQPGRDDCSYQNESHSETKCRNYILIRIYKTRLCESSKAQQRWLFVLAFEIYHLDYFFERVSLAGEKLIMAFDHLHEREPFLLIPSHLGSGGKKCTK